MKRAVHNALNFGINVLRGRFAVILRAHHVATEENIFLRLAVKHVAEFFAHTPVHDHRFGQRGRLLDVHRRATRNVVGDIFLGDAPRHRHDDGVNGLLAPHVQHVVLRHRDAQRPAARNDCNLVQRMRVLEQHAYERVTRFVPRRCAFFLIAHRHAATFAAPANFVARLFQFRLLHRFFSRARSQQCGFVQ